jgi:hypothetical protein
VIRFDDGKSIPVADYHIDGDRLTVRTVSGGTVVLSTDSVDQIKKLPSPVE